MIEVNVLKEGKESESIATLIIVPLVAICMLFCALAGLCCGYGWKFTRVEHMRIDQRDKLEWDICDDEADNNLDVKVDTFTQEISHQYSNSHGTQVQISRLIPSNVKL